MEKATVTLLVEKGLDDLIVSIQKNSPDLSIKNIIAIIADHADQRALDIFQDRHGWKEEFCKSIQNS